MAKRLLLAGILITVLLVPALFVALVVPQALPASLVKHYPSSLRRGIVTETVDDAIRKQFREPKEAERLVGFALVVDPESPRALDGACQVYAPVKALSYCRHLVAIEPGKLYAWDRLATVLWATGNLKEAGDIHLRQLQLHPCLFDEYFSYRDLLRRQGKGEESIPALRTALKLREQCDPQHRDPEFAEEILGSLGWEFLAAKRYDEAIAAARLLVKEPAASPLDAQTRHLLLAMALQGRGAQALARQEYALANTSGVCRLVEGKDHLLGFHCSTTQ